MSDFKRQLEEDFKIYRERFPNIQNIEKDEWAFNYWVLDKLFSVEEEVIEDYIVDYNDKGIDCYVWHEDTKDLYLIQNKYYSDETPVTVDYLVNDFLTRSIGALEKGSYKRSPALQDIFDKFSPDEEFCVYFHLYVTNNTFKNKTLIDAAAKFNEKYASKRQTVKLFTLDDIEAAYYGEPIKDRVSFSFTISTINKGTELIINNDAYKMTQALDAKYVLTPVISLYDMVKESRAKQYPLFDENIREYLGSNGQTNKAIKHTLESSEDRRNFFFYNNGVTIIANEIGAADINPKTGMREFNIENPQVVNGCQTVSTIYETLSGFRDEVIRDDFKDTYVMLKILKIPSKDESLRELYKNIVTYNNSQNSINEKNFVAISDVFKRVQTELEGKGFLLCIKQSDKYKFSEKYKQVTSLLNLNKGFLTLFGLEEMRTRNDFTIQLEKFLQVLISFADNPQAAVQRKSKLLVRDSRENETVVEFIKQPTLTSNDYLYLYLLYLRAEKIKRESQDGKNPNPFYLVYCFARYGCKGDTTKISSLLSTSDAVNNLIKKYTLAIMMYYNKWKEEHPGKEYNDMIKAAVQNELLDKSVYEAESVIDIV